MRAGVEEGVEKPRRREQRAGRTQVWRLLAGAREKRTSNMYAMFVTLEVLRLSGWLNADALCQDQGKHWKRGDMRAGVAGGRGEASAA